MNGVMILKDGSDDPVVLQKLVEGLGAFLNGHFMRLEHDLGAFGFLVRIVDASETLDFTGTRLLVEPLGSLFSASSSGHSTYTSK